MFFFLLQMIEKAIHASSGNQPAQDGKTRNIEKLIYVYRKLSTKEQPKYFITDQEHFHYRKLPRPICDVLPCFRKSKQHLL